MQVTEAMCYFIVKRLILGACGNASGLLADHSVQTCMQSVHTLTTWK